MNKYGTDIELDKLVDSEDYEDRIKAAEQGYGLDILINDTDEDVRKAVYDYLDEHNYKSIFDWAKNNNVDLDINEWLNSDDWIKRYEVARQGYRLDKLFNDEDWLVRDAVNDYLEEYHYTSIFEWAKNINVDLDIDLNIDIDEWVNSDDYHKRCIIAEQGYGLDKLVYDEDRDVRYAVAEQGYGLDILVNDKDWQVRRAVAKQGYGLNKLINDEDWTVRRAVAIQGYGLDKLINDKDSSVREVVYDYLKKNDLTLAEWCIQNNKSPVIIQNLKDFIYKVFEDLSNESYENKESIVLMTIDTKIPLIKLEKTRVENKNCFKFIVDISNKNDNFKISSIFNTKEKFDQLLQLTINALQGYSQFNKYADELENCL